MTKATRVRQARIEAMESEFDSLLLACLAECAKGRWGLFGQNLHLDPEDRYWSWPEARRLRSLASEIQLESLDTGQVHPLCEKSLSLCDLDGSNVPGEPRLAASFLKEIGAA